MKFKTYRLTLRSDNGIHRITTAALSSEAAIKIVMECEKCPRRAIIKVTGVTR